MNISDHKYVSESSSSQLNASTTARIFRRSAEKFEVSRVAQGWLKKKPPWRAPVTGRMVRNIVSGSTVRGTR